jgi:hypothetical protein
MQVLTRKTSQDAGADEKKPLKMQVLRRKTSQDAGADDKNLSRCRG